MKNILVTGAAGFIGSEVVNVAFKTINLNKLVVLDRLDYCSDINNIKEEIRNNQRFEFIQGDLCDYNLMLKILTDNDIDTVIHMAAQTHVDLSFTNSLQFTKDNVLGTHTLVEACRIYNQLNKFIFMSSDEVLGSISLDEKVPCKEDYLPSPTNPYSASKVSGEYIIKSYGYSYHFPYIIIRGNNVYGPKQYPDKLIPKFITLLLNDQSLPIQGDGSAARTFIHVNDMAKGILTVTRNGQIGEIYHIGSKNEYSVMEMAHLLTKMMKKELKLTFVTDRNFNDQRYFIDSSKVLSLGWKEEISFNDGLLSTIKWYK